MDSRARKRVNAFLLDCFERERVEDIISCYPVWFFGDNAVQHGSTHQHWPYLLEEKRQELKKRYLQDNASVQTITW